LRPDLVVFLEARPEILLHRAISKYGSLDYWESGMDLSLSRDLFESFFLYQDRLSKEFAWVGEEYGFHRVDANRAPEVVHEEVRQLVAPLYGRVPARPAPGKPKVPVSRPHRRAASV
jgi:dTMP kinase